MHHFGTSIPYCFGQCATNSTAQHHTLNTLSHSTGKLPIQESTSTVISVYLLAACSFFPFTVCYPKMVLLLITEYSTYPFQ